MKLARIFLTLVLIPTFVFMAVCLCACPGAQASVSDQLEFHKKAHCCCPENDNSCKSEAFNVQKDSATNTETFQLSKISQSAQFLASNIFSAEHIFSHQNLALMELFPSPNTLPISTIVLRI